MKQSIHALGAAFLLLALVDCSFVSAANEKTNFVPAFDRFHESIANDVQSGGALLVTELSCTACHSTADQTLQPKRGPKLDGVGARVDRDWLHRFLLDPQSEKPGTTMPHVLHGLPIDIRRGGADAIVAFLSTQQRPFRELTSTAGNPIAFEFWRKGNKERGQKLYHQIGCVACHESDASYSGERSSTSDLEKLLAGLDPEEIRELGLADVARPISSVPLPDLSAKYSLRSLTYFLLHPSDVRPAGRMPNLKLQPNEAADIAKYLLQDTKIDDISVTETADEGLVAEGKRLFVDLRCNNCHDIGDALPSKMAKPLRELKLDAGQTCLNKPPTDQPVFSTTEAQNAAIAKLLTDLQQSKDNALVKDEVNLRMLQLNCLACHERNGRGGVGPKRGGYFETAGHVDLGDEGRLPPPLTRVGYKLQPSWLMKVLEGKGDIRHHMTVRMPVFPQSVAASLPAQFASEDRVDQPAGKSPTAKSKELVEAGRTLLELGCIQCHPLRGEQMPGVVGVDIAKIKDRVSFEWFHDFILNPAELKTRTRMPTFFPNGRSNASALLNGDVEKQIAGLWWYLNEIDKQPLPAKLEASKLHNFELVPKDRPIVLRTFMKEAGTHAIAVGFPQKLHIAFDAEAVRVTQAWRGRFLDAHGTWFDRFTPPAVPLSNDIVNFSAGMPFALLDSPDDEWPIEVGEQAGFRFRGYRLDKNGTPTFLYEFKQFEIEDQFKPTVHKTLIRRLRIARRGDDKVEKLWFRAGTESTDRDEREKKFPVVTQLQVSIDGKSRTEINVGGDVDLGQIVQPISLQRQAAIEVTYEW